MKLLFALAMAIVLAGPVFAQDEGRLLTSGEAVDGRLPDRGEPYETFRIEVPPGTERLDVEVTAEGDADVYVKEGSPILEFWVDEATVYSNSTDNDEHVVLTTSTSPALAATVYYIDVVSGESDAAKPFDFTITATLQAGDPASGALPPSDGESAAEAQDSDDPNIRADHTQEVAFGRGGLNYQTFRVVVEPDVEEVTISIDGGGGDMALYARYGAEMQEWDEADHAAEGFTDSETITIERSGAPRLRTGTYFVDVARAGEAPRTATFSVEYTRGRVAEDSAEIVAVPPEPSSEDDVTGSIRGDSAWTVAIDGETHYRTYTIFVPKGSRSLLIEAAGSQVDMDLYLRHEEPIIDYAEDPDHSAASERRDENIYLDATTDPPLLSGKYYLDVSRYGDEATGPIEMSVRFDADRPPPTPASSSPILEVSFGDRIVTEVDRSQSKAARYSFEVPAGTESLHIAALGATRDIDLFVAHERVITSYTDETGFDHSRVSDRLSEVMEISRDSYPPLETGTYYLDVVSLIPDDQEIEFQLFVTLNEPTSVDAAGFRVPPYPRADDLTPLEQALLATVEVVGESGAGSGTSLTPNGLIVTNYHVLESDDGFQTQDIYIAYSDRFDEPPRQVFIAEVVESDKDLDLALLRIDRDVFDRPLPADLNLPWIAIGDPSRLRIGNQIYVAGFPGVGGHESRSSISVTRGIVTGFETEVGRRGWVKTDARINAGNSGGTALDEEFRFFGVPSEELVDADDELGYIRPTDLLPAAWRDMITRELDPTPAN